MREIRGTWYFLRICGMIDGVLSGKFLKLAKTRLLSM
jgi:hypothetical protein